MYKNTLQEFHKKFGVISMDRYMPTAEVQTASGIAYQYMEQGATITIELPMNKFFELVSITTEFENLEQDPATSNTIKEAKIIYKLKHGTDYA